MKLVNFHRNGSGLEARVDPEVQSRAMIMGALAEVQAAAGRKYESARNAAIPDFSLTDEQQRAWKGAEDVGWAGFYRDTKALLGAQCHWDVAYKGEVVEEPRIQALADLIKPEGWSQVAMRFRALQLQAGLGEHALFPIDHSRGGLSWRIAHPEQLGRAQTPGMFSYRTRRDGRPGGHGYHEFPVSNLCRIFVPDAKYEDEAHSSLSEALDEIDLYRSTVLNMKRGVDSRMIMNGLLYIPTQRQDIGTAVPQPISGPGVSGHDVQSGPVDGNLATLIKDFVKYGGRAYADLNGTDMASRLPFPFPHHSKPEMVEVGRAIDPTTLEALDSIVRSAGRGLKIPQQFLVSGEGATHAWGAAELRRALHEQSIFPELDQQDAQFTQWALWPLLNAIPPIDGTSIEDWSLISDRSQIEIKGDQTSIYFDALEKGIAEPDWVAGKIGIPVEGRLQLPSDITSFEHWQLIANRAKPGDVTLSTVARDNEDQTDRGGETGLRQVAAAALEILP